MRRLAQNLSRRSAHGATRNEAVVVRSKKYLFFIVLCRLVPIAALLCAVCYYAILNFDGGRHRGVLLSIVVLLISPIIFFDLLSILIMSAVGKDILFVDGDLLVYISKMYKKTPIGGICSIEVTKEFWETYIIIRSNNGNIKIPTFLFAGEPEEVADQVRGMLSA